MSTNQEKAVARHAQEVTGASYMACLAAARSSRLRVPDGPDFIARWKVLAVQDAKARALVAKPKTYQERLDAARAVDLSDNLRLERLGNGYVRAEPIDPTKRHGPSRGVEGELKPLPKAHRSCGRRFCRKSALTGSAFCEDHSDESQPLKSAGRKS